MLAILKYVVMKPITFNPGVEIVSSLYPKCFCVGSNVTTDSIGHGGTYPAPLLQMAGHRKDRE